jgi:exopolyphosphatase/guanosine-5'-triphosphate,3'-diphosphate pyrophosphatase
LAAIDVGTNSVHMVIADVRRDGRIDVVDRMKEMIRLGGDVFRTGRLTAGSMALATRTLGTFGRLARARGVQRLRAVATSAVREARNGAEFVERLRRQTGVPVRIISGIDEARLIVRAVLHATGADERPRLMVDVGGGSVELALLERGRVSWLASLPLGVARLSEQFLAHDPPLPRELKRLEHHLDEELGPYLTRARRMGIAEVVGTSGTITALVTMARAARGDDTGRLDGARASAAEIARLRRQLVRVDPERRAELPGADSKRLDQLPAAAALLEYITRTARVDTIRLCSWALREGLLLELAKLPFGRRASAQHAQLGAVERLARRWTGDNAHGRQVARLAMALFDGTHEVLDLAPESRDLLQYAALLHDIGHAVSHDRHHRHTAYLVRNGEFPGFTTREVEIIAETARHHRKQIPKASTPELEAMPAKVRRTVRALAALLRIADALDRTHTGVLRGAAVQVSPARVVIDIDTGGRDGDLELWAAERRVDLLSRLVDRPVRLRVRAKRAPARRRGRARARSSRGHTRTAGA